MGSSHSQIKASKRPSETSECYEADIEELEQWLSPLGIPDVKEVLKIASINDELYTIEFKMNLVKNERDILKAHIEGKK